MAYYEDIAVLFNNEVKCTLCNIIVHDSTRLLEAHLHDEKHRELFIKRLMITNHIVTGISNLFCNICNSNIEIPNLIDHIQSQIHQTNYAGIKDLVNLDGNLIVLPENTSSCSSAYCIICDGNVKFVHNSVKDHISSEKHKRGRAMVLQPLNGIFSVEGCNDKYLWCKICQKFFDNFVEIIFEHVNNSEHAKKIAKILRLIDGQNVDIDKYLQDYKEDKAFCNKCKMDVPCNVDNLQSHIKGKKHKSEKQ